MMADRSDLDWPFEDRSKGDLKERDTVSPSDYSPKVYGESKAARITGRRREPLDDHPVFTPNECDGSFL